MDNSKQTKKQEMQQAGKNTAHVAGKAAATYFGGTIGNIAYDKISQTRLGQKIENGAGKVISKVPGVNKINKKLNDTGLVDAANKATDLVGGKASLKTAGKAGNLASRNLKNGSTSQSGFNSLNKKRGHKNLLNDSETPKVLKNNKNHQKNGLFGSRSNNFNNTSDDKNDNNTSENNNDVDDNVDSETTQKNNINIIPKNFTLKLLLAKVVAVFAILFLVFMLIIVIISPIVTVISGFLSFFSVESHKEPEKNYVSDPNDAKALAAEIKFNDAIVGSEDGSVKGIIAEYQEKYGVTIDRFLLEAVVLYRYTGVNNYIYDDETLNELDQDELEQEIEDKYNELEENQGEEEENSDEDDKPDISYDEAIKVLKNVATMMVYKENGTYFTDTTIGGKFYNDLIESKFLTEYYKDLLIDQKYETRKQLVDYIFEYAENARSLFFDDNNGSIISDTTVVYLQTCEVPYKYKTINNIDIWDNPSATGSYPQYVNMVDYLKGVVYGEIGDSIKEEYREGLKAFIIAAQTFLIRHKAAGFDLKNGTMYIPAGNCKQLCCDPNVGCTYTYNGNEYGTSFSGPNRFSSYKFVRKPMPANQSALLDSILEEIFGYVMVKKGVTSDTFSGSSSIPSSAGSYLNECSPGTCFSQEDAKQDAKKGMTYTEILNKYYSRVGGGNGFDLINIKEGLYYESNDNYNGTINLNENFHYHQGDSPWGSQKLCGSGAISSNGCNVTSAAIAISLLKNQRITPETLNNRQSENRYCSTNSRPEMIMTYIQMYGLTAKEVKKKNQAEVSDMLSKIATGNYVAIARIAPQTDKSLRYYTGGGHYIAIVGVKSENGKQKVLVWDPGSRSKSRDNYWADLNVDILPLLRNDYSFILAGRS